MPLKRTINAGKFKAECLRIMDQVNETKQSIVVTKRNVPVVIITPASPETPPLFGKMRGSIHIKGDVISSIDEAWDADR